jgi:hypothetical protein
MNRLLPIIGLSAMLGLTACGGSGTSPKTPTTQNLGQNVLQLSVGTANIYGDTGAGFVGVNVATTYRQSRTQLSPGDSATAVNQPTLSGPFALTSQYCIQNPCGGAGTAFSTIYQGPAPVEISGGQMTGTSQTGNTNTTFGTAGGVSGLGLEPFNFNSEGGVPYSYVPYVLPAYDPAGDTNSMLPLGFPPAFPSTAGGPNPAYSMGIDVFAQVTPVSGAYSLNAAVPISNGPTFSQTANATMTSTALLPNFVQQLPSLDSNDDGGATIPVALPAGVIEAYVQIIDFGPGGGLISCNGSDAAPTTYTLFVNASGPATLAGNLGPGGKPSICSANLNTTANGAPSPSDAFSVQLVGFDYHWYEASYPNSNGNPAPAISNGNGQSNITISGSYTYQALTGARILKGSHVRHALAKAHFNVRR